MTGHVVGLRDAQFVPPGQPNPKVIAHLERWLVMAQRGEVDGIAIAVSKPNGKIAFNYYLGPEPATFRVVAAVSLMDGDLRQVMNDEMTDGDVPEAGDSA